MTLRDEIMDLRPKVREARIRAGGGGKEPDILYALLFKIVKVLEQIEQNTRRP